MSQASIDPVGYYAQICRDRKAQEVERNESGLNADMAAEKFKRNPGADEAKFWKEGKISPKHIDSRSRRFMSKVFLIDLMREWKIADGVPVNEIVDEPDLLEDAA